MSHAVTSGFSVSSSKFNSEFLKETLPWRIIETSTHVPDGKAAFHVTVFDLGVGKHDRVDQHLVAAKSALLKQETELETLSGDCHYALWLAYHFPSKDGAINVSHAVSGALGLLRVELIFQLKPLNQ